MVPAGGPAPLGGAVEGLLLAGDAAGGGLDRRDDAPFGLCGFPRGGAQGAAGRA